MTSNASVDTNVLIYLHDASAPLKRQKAKTPVAGNPAIPAQVISGYLNTPRRLLSLSNDDLLFRTAGLFQPCSILPTLPSTLYLASSLHKKYRFQLFDAIIVSASVEGGCEILYSEDKQHGPGG